MRLYPCENAKFRLASQVPTTYMPFQKNSGRSEPQARVVATAGLSDLSLA